MRLRAILALLLLAAMTLSAQTIATDISPDLKGASGYTMNSTFAVQ